jgi:hypothetical protein
MRTGGAHRWNSSRAPTAETASWEGVRGLTCDGSGTSAVRPYEVNTPAVDRDLHVRVVACRR